MAPKSSEIPGISEEKTTAKWVGKILKEIRLKKNENLQKSHIKWPKKFQKSALKHPKFAKFPGIIRKNVGKKLRKNSAHPRG